MSGVTGYYETALERTWKSPELGVRAWFADVSHVAIGRRFLVTALVFFLLGGVEALLMRLQLARPDNHVINPDLYDQLFTVHGSTMMFLFAVPVMQGFGLYLVPLMVGARNSAFPRLAAYSYYTYVIGGLLLYAALFLRTGPDVGWFSYVPLAEMSYTPTKRADVWAQLVTFTELSALSTAINLITTIFKHRAPGMSLDRMPLFVWSMLVQSFMVVFAMPAVMLGTLLLAMDRLVNTQFFVTTHGGDALLWQHMFWFFGHPEVYIIFVPALGMMSELMAAFARRPVFGYSALVLSLVATGFVSFGLWVHHMFATPLPALGKSFFTASSILIALPTGVQFFCWIATLFTGSIRLAVPMFFALAFFGVFVIGGVTGVMLASVPLDLQLHDTHFVVAHLHYVLIGGAVFPLLGGVYYWFPKLTGRMLDARLGHWNFWTFLAGFNLVFFPLHVLGLRGMPRRIYTYAADRGWSDLNLLATCGAGVLALSVLILLWNLARSAQRGARAGADPWAGPGLEWATSSPPPSYDFDPLPTVSGRDALWTRRADQPIVYGVRVDRREALVTRLVDAEPDHRTELPGPTLWPLAAALGTGVTFIAGIFTPWAVVFGGALIGMALIGWYWPRPPHKEEHVQHGAPLQSLHGETVLKKEAGVLDVSDLPTTAFGSRDPVFWGVIGLVAIESTVFALLFAGYIYLKDHAQLWPPTAISQRSFFFGSLGLAPLLVSCYPVWRSGVAAKRGDVAAARNALILATVLSSAFLVLRFLEFSALDFRWDAHAHGSMFWTILGMHTMHAIIASLENLLFIAVLVRGPVEEKHLVDVYVSAFYWYFMVTAAAFCYAFCYLDPLWMSKS